MALDCLPNSILTSNQKFLNISGMFFIACLFVQPKYKYTRSIVIIRAKCKIVVKFHHSNCDYILLVKRVDKCMLMHMKPVPAYAIDFVQGAVKLMN